MADSRGVFDLGVEMPDVLVLDTSAISVMLFEDQETHPDYTAFLARAVAENTVLSTANCWIWNSPRCA